MNEDWLVDFSLYPEMHISNFDKCNSDTYGYYCSFCGYRLSYFKLEGQNQERYYCRNRNCENKLK